MEITLQGSLKSFRLPDIFTFLNRNLKTGTLSVNNRTSESYVFFEDGTVVFATSNQERFRLGEILRDKNRITETQRCDVERLMLQERIKFGRAAVQSELLAETELRDYLKIQVAEILYDCLNWEEGGFSFVDAMQLPEDAVIISMDLTNLLLEAARRLEKTRDFLQMLPKTSFVLRLVKEPEKLQGLALSLNEWKILYLINGKRSIEQICKEARTEDVNVYRMLYALDTNQLIEVVPEEELYLSGLKDAEMQDTPVEDIRAQWKTLSLKNDTDLLVSPEANLSFEQVLCVTLARLTVKDKSEGSQIFPLVEEDYYIGRQLGNQIHLPDPSVSNVHARIFKGPEGYVVEDLNSRNGTFLNGEKIDRKLLHENDLIRIGNTQMVYNIIYEVKRVSGEG